MENIILALKKIDDQISLQANEIDQLVYKLTFEEIAEFELGKEIHDLPNKIFSKGIYFFEFRNDNIHKSIVESLDEFSKLWQEGNVTWVPGIKKRRLSAHQALADWIPLYIGKSKNVGFRINEHINQPEGKTTFGMKLKARQNLYNKKFRVSWIPLDVNNYDMIAPAIESRLRNMINPLVGKQ